MLFYYFGGDRWGLEGGGNYAEKKINKKTKWMRGGKGIILYRKLIFYVGDGDYSGVLRVVTFTTSEVTFFIFLKSEGHFEVTFEKCPKK